MSAVAITNHLATIPNDNEFVDASILDDSNQTRDVMHGSGVARTCRLAAATELTGAYNIGTKEAYSCNKMVAMINDALGTNIESESIECPFDGYLHDTMADAPRSAAQPARSPKISFEEGGEVVCASSRSEESGSVTVRFTDE